MPKMLAKYVAPLSLAVLAQSAFAAETTREYTWLTVGEPSGSQTVTHTDDGATRVHWEFNDRGRGPDTETTVSLDERGYPKRLSVTGNNYDGGEVDERFEIAEGRAAWRSNIESGTAPAANAGFYVAHNAPPELAAVLARALLASESGSVELLPAGQATIEKVTQRTLNQDGQSRTITLYAIHGIDTDPAHLWLDEHRELFGIDYGWFGITERGWESHIDTLKEAEEAATRTHFEALARDLARDTGDMLVITGARIFDSLTGELTEPATVFIWKGEISAIYFAKSDGEVDIPDEATVIDGAGQTLLPALWDMHAHVDMGSLLNYLASGVTNVRDMANDPERIDSLRDDVDAGTVIGPDVHPLGFIDKRGEFSAPTGMLADKLEEAMELIDWYARRGFIGIKLYSSIEPEWVSPLAGYAHERKLRVMGHVPAYMNARQAIEAGYDEITHVNMILLNFMGAEELDTRTPTRFVVPGERAGDLDLASPAVQDFIALMVERGISHDPTLSIFMDMFLNEPGKVSPIFRDIADHLPTSVRRQAIAGSGRNAGKEELFARSAQRSLELVKLLHDRGVRLVPGTDNMLPGFTLIRELMYYVEAGIPPGAALQLATVGSARVAGRDDRLGSISVGKSAHMHLVNGNPTQDISTLYRVTHVIKGRQHFLAPEILKAQGFKPFE